MRFPDLMHRYFSADVYNDESISDFDYIAPLMWLHTGGEGALLDEQRVRSGYGVSKNYAIIWDFNQTEKLVRALRGRFGQNGGPARVVYAFSDTKKQVKRLTKSLGRGYTVIQLSEEYVHEMRETVRSGGTKPPARSKR